MNPSDKSRTNIKLGILLICKSVMISILKKMEN